MTTSLLRIAFGLLPSIILEVDTINLPNVNKKEIYLKTQCAGNIGLVSFGIGFYFFDNKITADLNYGVLPKFINGTRIQTFSTKPAYNFLKYNFSSGCGYFYGGINFVYSIGHNIYSIPPNIYPQDYYKGNALRINPLIGLRFGLDLRSARVERLSFFTECGTVDYKIWYALKNSEISTFEIVNLCFGFVFDLR